MKTPRELDNPKEPSRRRPPRAKINKDETATDDGVDDMIRRNIELYGP